VVSGLVKTSQYFREQGYDPAELGPIAVRNSKKTDEIIKVLTRAQDE